VQQGIHLCTSHRLLHHLSATDQGHLYDSHDENDAAADDVIDAASAKRTPMSAFKKPKEAFLVCPFLWRQHVSGASISLVSAFLWCQSLSGVRTFLVPEHLWCPHFSGARAFMVSALFWYQHFSGVSTFLVSAPAARPVR
jgi:hypothetical protein